VIRRLRATLLACKSRHLKRRSECMLTKAQRLMEQATAAHLAALRLRERRP
jgi:hypothetical protein